MLVLIEKGMTPLPQKKMSKSQFFPQNPFFPQKSEIIPTIQNIPPNTKYFQNFEIFQIIRNFSKIFPIIRNFTTNFPKSEFFSKIQFFFKNLTFLKTLVKFFRKSEILFKIQKLSKNWKFSQRSKVLAKK